MNFLSWVYLVTYNGCPVGVFSSSVIAAARIRLMRDFDSEFDFSNVEVFRYRVSSSPAPYAISRQRCTLSFRHLFDC